MIICTGTPAMTMHPPEDPSDALGMVPTVDALDGASPPAEPACHFGGLLKLLVSEVAVLLEGECPSVSLPTIKV